MPGTKVCRGVRARGYVLACASLLVAFVSSGPAAARTSLGDVREQLGWTSLRVQLELTVQRGSGEAKAKQMEVQLRDDPGGQKLLAVFTQPSHMAGTAFLALTDDDRDDRYFLYLRSLRRAKRVPTGSENFMLRDFLSLYLLKPRPELWSEGPDPARPAPVVPAPAPPAPEPPAPVSGPGPATAPTAASGPAPASSPPRAPSPPPEEALAVEARDARSRELTGYARQVHRIDPSRRVILGTEFFDAAGARIRAQRVTEFRTVEGHVLPWVFETEDTAEGVRATIRLLRVDWNAELPESHFTLRHLKRL